jgi:UDP-N-acetyl-D-glucosamine dehydrogenase
MDSVEDMMSSVKEADMVVIITDHKAYDYVDIVEAAQSVFDSRNATRTFAKNNQKVVRL